MGGPQQEHFVRRLLMKQIPYPLLVASGKYESVKLEYIGRMSKFDDRGRKQVLEDNSYEIRGPQGEDKQVDFANPSNQIYQKKKTTNLYVIIDKYGDSLCQLVEHSAGNMDKQSVAYLGFEILSAI